MKSLTQTINESITGEQRTRMLKLSASKGEIILNTLSKLKDNKSVNDYLKDRTETEIRSLAYLVLGRKSAITKSVKSLLALILRDLASD